MQVNGFERYISLTEQKHKKFSLELLKENSADFFKHFYDKNH